MIKFCDEKGDEKEEPVGQVEIGPVVEGLAGEETDAVTPAQSPEPTTALSAVENEQDGTLTKVAGSKRAVKAQELAPICSNMFDVLEQEGDQVEEPVERIAIAEVDVPSNGEDGKGLPNPEEVKEKATKISELGDLCVRVALAKKNANKKDWWERAKSANSITRNYFVLKRNGNILCQVHEKGDEKKEPVAHDKLVEIGPGFLVPGCLVDWILQRIFWIKEGELTKFEIPHPEYLNKNGVRINFNDMGLLALLASKEDWDGAAKLLLKMEKPGDVKVDTKGQVFNPFDEGLQSFIEKSKCGSDMECVISSIISYCVMFKTIQHLILSFKVLADLASPLL